MVTEKLYDANALITVSVDSSCQGISRLLDFAYEGGANRVTVDSHGEYFLSRVEIKDYKLKLMEEILIISWLIITKQII